MHCASASVGQALVLPALRHLVSQRAAHHVHVAIPVALGLVLLVVLRALGALLLRL